MAATSTISSSHTAAETRRFKNVIRDLISLWDSFSLRLPRHDRPCFQNRLPNRDRYKLRALLEPRLRRRLTPQRLALRIVQRPAQRFEVGIDREIVAGEQLDAVAVRVADIKKERVRDAVPARPALHVGEIARGRHHIAKVQDVERSRRPDADVMQPRSAAVGEGEVVDIALAVQPNRPELAVAVVSLGVFGQAETELG